MNSFSVTRKKTPFQKHRKEEEAKKKRAEDEAARFYAEFVESFQGSDTPGSKLFVWGGMISPNEKLRTDSEERTPTERKERPDEARESSRKCHGSQSRSRSPQRKSSNIDRERANDTDRDRDRHRERDRSQETESERGREYEKSGSRERYEKRQGQGPERGTGIEGENKQHRVHNFLRWRNGNVYGLSAAIKGILKSSHLGMGIFQSQGLAF